MRLRPSYSSEVHPSQAWILSNTPRISGTCGCALSPEGVRGTRTRSRPALPVFFGFVVLVLLRLLTLLRLLRLLSPSFARRLRARQWLLRCIVPSRCALFIVVEPSILVSPLQDHQGQRQRPALPEVLNHIQELQGIRPVIRVPRQQPMHQVLQFLRVDRRVREVIPCIGDG